MSRGCCVALPRGAMGLSAVCDCGIFGPYSLFLQATFFSGEGAAIQVLVEKGKSITIKYYRDVVLNN